ncbi:copper resistance CopC family protein [Microbacterium sp. YY-03]|uniref:copper resistance CopC family protein n=1 Tax=Microbacterium sp. YY-03 TaxID=3421636 RepID=UPI003D17141B
MRIARISSAVALAALLVLMPTTAALAHEELISSTPSAGQELETAPETIMLTFSAEVMTMGAAIIVVDADGTDWVLDEPVVDYSEVTAVLDASMPDGGYEARWRVVSSDGHPISGIIPFTVGDAEPLVRESAAPMATEPSATEPGTAKEQEQGTTENGGVPRALLIGGAAAVIAAAGFTIFSVARRRARRGDSETTDA